MSRITTVSTIFACVTVLLSGAAVAQPFGFGNRSGPGWSQGGGMGWGMMGQPGRGRHMMIDANDDGAISAEEAASEADEVFTTMDGDDDGNITKEEYMAVRMGPQMGFNAERQATMQKQKEARFKDMDASADGKVSKAEFLEAAKTHHASADADKDGKVTPWEHRRQNWN